MVLAEQFEYSQQHTMKMKIHTDQCPYPNSGQYSNSHTQIPSVDDIYNIEPCSNFAGSGQEEPDPALHLGISNFLTLNGFCTKIKSVFFIGTV